MSLVDRRRQLVDAAIQVMTRDGVTAATTRAVVAEAGVSLSVFHYCFDSKRQMLEAVVDELVERSAARQSEPPTDTSVIETLRHSVYDYWHHVQANPEVHQLSYEVTQFCLRDPELRAISRLQYDLYAQVIADRLLAGGVGADVATKVQARYLAVIIDGVTLDWLVRRDDAEAEAVLETAIAHVEALLRVGAA